MRVCENLYQIRIDFKVTEEVKRYVYVYLITGKQCYLVDAGVAGCETEIERYMKDLGRDPEEIRAILLTHAHPDHIGAAAEMKRRTGCKIYASEKERNWIEDIDDQFRDRPIPNFYTLVGGSVKVDGKICEGHVIMPESGMTLRVLDTPGHSKGSVSYIWEEAQVMFTGDAILDRSGFPIIIDEGESIASLQKIQSYKNIKYCCPAWDKVYRDREIEESVQRSITLLRRLESCMQKVDRKYKTESEEKKAEIISWRMGWDQAYKNPLFRTSLEAISIEISKREDRSCCYFDQTSL